MPGNYHIELGTVLRGEQAPHPVHDYFMVAAQAA
jgi:hypothetical protein